MCKRCGHTTTKRNKLKLHLERKFICEASISDVDPETLIKELYSSSEFKCRYCIKSYKHRSGRSLHEKYCSHKHKHKQQQQQTQANISANIVSNTTNHNNNNNTINNTQNIYIINLNPGQQLPNKFGNENINYLNPSFLEKLINDSKKGSESAINKLVKAIHFNEEHPENHNMCINNLRSKHAEIYDGKNFIVRDKKEVLHHAMRQAINYMMDYMDETDVCDDEKGRIADTIMEIEDNILSKDLPKAESYTNAYNNVEQMSYNKRKLFQNRKKKQYF